MFLAVVFLCGRPGCGRESSATLQIDAPSSTISLVDPRVSRDGVPLCPHHADSTTPPMGWSMNDLRSRNRTLAPVRTLGPRTGEIVSAPPGKNGGSKRKGKKPNPLFQGSNPDLVGRKRPRSGTPPLVDQHTGDEPLDPNHTDDSMAEGGDATDADPLNFEVSRQLRSMSVTALPERGEPTGDGSSAPSDLAGDEQAPLSRPARRREVVEDDAEAELDEVALDDDTDDDKFPWHYQFDDDEPQELQAKSPLLSRAFRSSVG